MSAGRFLFIDNFFFFSSHAPSRRSSQPNLSPALAPFKLVPSPGLTPGRPRYPPDNRASSSPTLPPLACVSFFHNDASSTHHTPLPHSPFLAGKLWSTSRQVSHNRGRQLVRKGRGPILPRITRLSSVGVVSRSALIHPLTYLPCGGHFSSSSRDTHARTHLHSLTHLWPTCRQTCQYAKN